MIQIPEKNLPPLLKRATYASAGTLISRVFAALSGILIARAVGPGMFGVYAAVLALIQFSSAFTQIGMITGLKREGSRSPEMMSGLLGNVLTVQLISGLASIGIAFAALPLVSNNPLAVTVFPPLALVCLSTLCADIFLAVLQIRGEQRLASFLLCARGLAFLVGVMTLSFFRPQVVILAWYHGICYLIATVLFVFLVTNRVPLKLEPAHLRNQIRGALPFGMSSAANSAFRNIPILFLSHFFPEESVGNFAVALRFMQISLLLGSAANVQAFVPALFGLFRTDHMRFTQVCSSIQRLYIPAGIFVASALYVFSEALVIVLQGEEYRPAIGMLRVLCWSAALTYWRYAASTALMTGDRMRVKLLLEICANCIVLLSSLLLIKQYGPMGASYTRIIGDFSLLVLMLNYVYVKGLYPFSGLIGTAVPSIATVLAAITFTQSMPGQYFLAPILFVASSAVFWYFYLRFRPQNKEVIRNS